MISYLDELAMCQPSRKAWDKLVWPPVSSVPSMPCQAEYFGYIQGLIVKLGLTMPPCGFCMSGENGGFICFALGMIFEGHVLVYNPSTNKAEWILVCSTTNDLSRTEEVSTLMMCNLVPHVPYEGASRLDQFGEHRDTEGGVGEASLTEVPCKEGLEEELMHKDELEDADNEDMDDMSASSSASSWESQHSTHHYSDRHHHPHSWAECCK